MLIRFQKTYVERVEYEIERYRDGWGSSEFNTKESRTSLKAARAQIAYARKVAKEHNVKRKYRLVRIEYLQARRETVIR